MHVRNESFVCAYHSTLVVNFLIYYLEIGIWCYKPSTVADKCILTTPLIVAIKTKIGANIDAN